MVVYADVLIAVNIIVDYFLLALTARILRQEVLPWRKIVGAVAAGTSSLVIFLPELSALAELLMRAVICGGIALICFGFHSVRAFLRAAAAFFGVSFGFAGAMLAFWYIFRPQGMVINNSAVYFNVSPLFLIMFSSIGYFAAALFKKLFSKAAPDAEECTVELFLGENRASCRAIVDSGNSIEDLFSDSEVIIADRRVAERLVPDALAVKARYRAVPCNTALATGLLDGWRCDRAYITCGGRRRELVRPIVAVSKKTLGGDYDAIINPHSL